MLDFNRANISATPISIAINDLITTVEPPEENVRQYLGASSIGSECLRRVQYDRLVDARHPTRTRDIFARGHFFEEVSRQHLIRAGFRFAPPERVRFAAVGRLLRGHADGLLISGPTLPGVAFPCIWEHKALGASGWRALERDGLEKAYPHYAAQVWLYQLIWMRWPTRRCSPLQTPIRASGFICFCRSMLSVRKKCRIVPSR
jgi:hypothetical protein